MEEVREDNGALNVVDWILGLAEDIQAWKENK
jgi:hypothetical protein